MQRLLVPRVLAVIGIVGCSSTKVYVDYDRDVDPSVYSTFAWAKTEELSLKNSAPLVHDRIVAYIDDKLQQGGLTRVEHDPDLHVTYHTNSREEVRLNTTHYGYHYGAGYYRHPYWRGGVGVSGARTTASTYTRGTFIIDIWDTASKNLVWRGAMENVVPENPAKAEAQIIDAIDKMIKLWQAERR